MNRYTVPWVPGLVNEFEGWMVRELLTAAALMRDEGVTVAEVTAISQRTLAGSPVPHHNRFVMLAMIAIEMGMFTDTKGTS